jgi:IclR family acetate operon transcriptional repressor
MRSAERTLDVLEMLARQPAPLDAATIARICRIPRSSTYHLLTLLRQRGFVAIDGDHGWTLGVQLSQLGANGPSLGEAVAVLEAFGREAGGLDAAELARRTGIHAARVSRALDALAAEGLVSARGDGCYDVALRTALLSTGGGSVGRLRAAARPVLETLRDRTGETANLVVREGEEAVYVEQAESRHALRHTGWVGRRIPLADSASGRVLQAGRGTEVVRDAIEPGVTAVASAVTAESVHGAALSVTGPTSRLRGEALREARRVVRAASDELAARLRG